jgi:hypothetical protein
MAGRVALFGSLAVGIIGIVFALNAGLVSEYTGAGLDLAASAIAFGVIGITFARRPPWRRFGQRGIHGPDSSAEDSEQSGSTS